MLETTNVKDLVEGEIRTLLLDDDSDSGSMSSDETLVGIGLNSLMLAQLLIELEAELGVDPFEAEFSITDMRTIGDLVGAYERAIESAKAA